MNDLNGLLYTLNLLGAELAGAHAEIERLKEQNRVLTQQLSTPPEPTP